MHLDLAYNISYEVSAILFLSILLIYSRIQFSAKEVSSRKFRQLVLMVIIANVLDVLTAIDISYVDRFPWLFNQIANTAYFLVLVYMLYLYISYIEIFLKHRISKFGKWANKILLCGCALMLFANIFTGWMFTFRNGYYEHGPLYLSVYLLTLVLLLESIIICLHERRKMRPRQMFSVLFFSIMSISGSLLQILFFPNVLLNLFLASLAVLVIMFALETPDYMRLTIAMEELRKTAEELDIAREDAEESRRAAEDANRAKSSFLASMSHEIRTPINGVLGMNSIILKESDDPRILEYARNIDSAGNGLLSLINDILDFSKIESGKMEIVPVEYELNNMIADCYNMVFMRAREKGLDLLFENNTTIPNRLYGDEVRVRQIIVNLLTNAVKYTEEGMVLLTADWEQGEDPSDMTLIVSVKDTGIGIKKKNIDKLFSAFSRVDQERNRNIEGTGLGLKITQQFLEMMGGTIGVESVYGAGSEFTVRIPQKIRGAEPLGEFSYHSVAAGDDPVKVSDHFIAPKARVLVVDDVELNLKVIAGLLKDTQIQIDTASSGAECISKIKAGAYDVILLDHLMPQMDGIETLTQLKNLDGFFNASTPVIMLTANAIQGAKEEYLKHGFTDYLSKPVREDELKSMLAKYLPADLMTYLQDENDHAMEAIDEAHREEELLLAIENEQKDNVTYETRLSKRFPFLDTNMGMIYCMNNEELYESVVREFKDSNRYDDIEAAFEEADMQNYSVMVHGVKSSAMTIGAPKLSEMAKGLEFASNSGDSQFVSEHHYEFMTAYGELLDLLAEIYGYY